MTSLQLYRGTEDAPRSRLPVRNASLALLAAALFNASLRAGGMNPAAWSLSLACIAAAAILFWTQTPNRDLAPRLPERLRQLFFVLVGLLILQVVPLPIAMVRLISATHGRALDPLPQVIPGAWFATLSLAPLTSLLNVVDLVSYAVVLLLARELTWRLHARAWLAALPIVMLGACQAVFGLVQYAGDPAHAVATGTYSDRDLFASFLEMCLPFAILYVWEIVARHRHRGEAVSIDSAIKLSAVLFIAAAILVSELRSLSRLSPVSTLLAFTVIVYIGLPVRWSRASSVATFLGMVAAMALCVVLLAPERLFLRYAGPTDDAGVYDVRQLIWRDTGRMLADHPATGVGFGAFASVFPYYQRELPNSTIRYAHNDYLQWLAELGLPGAAVLMTILVLLVGLALRACKPEMSKPPRPRFRRLALACTGALGAMLLHSFGEYNFYVPANALTFAWIAGMAAGLDPRIRLRLPRAAASASATFSVDGRSIPVTIIHPAAPPGSLPKR